MYMLVVMLLVTACTTTSTSFKPTVTAITDRTTIRGVGHRGEAQRESERVRTITETVTRCCGPRGSILDIWNQQETVIRETDQAHQQIIHPIKGDF